MPSKRSDTRGIDVEVPADEDVEEGDEELSDEEEDASEDDDEFSDEEASDEDEEAEDEQYDEDVEEVEAEEAPEKRRGTPKRRPSGGRASGGAVEEKPAPGRRIWAVVLALLIIVPVAGLVYFFYGPSGDIQTIDLIAQPYTDNAGISGMSLVAQVSTGKPSHLSGTADIAISINGQTTYTGTMEVSESQGLKTIPLSQFASGNGDYKVEVKFQGKSSSTTFTETHIIEKLSVTAYNITRTTNSTIEYGTARMGVRLIFLNNVNESQMAVAGDRLEVEITGGGGTSKYTENIASKLQLNMDYSLPGNGSNGQYTVKATFQNSKVKTGSVISTITTLATDTQTNQPYVMVFIPPRAEAGPDQTVQWKLVDGGGKVTLDGSNSIAYGGAKVTNWTWDYGDDYIEDGMKVTYTYMERNTYLVTLLIMDSNGNTDTDTCTVTVV